MKAKIIIPRKVKILRFDRCESCNPFMELEGIVGDRIYSLAKNRTDSKFYIEFNGGEIEIKFESGIRKARSLKIKGLYQNGKKVYPVKK